MWSTPLKSEDFRRIPDFCKKRNKTKKEKKKKRFLNFEASLTK